MATITAGDFEWHDRKAATNLTDHDVSFEEAAVALADPNSYDFDDLADPTRMASIALNPMTGVLYVVTTEGSEQRTRIISARKAHAHEQRKYTEGLRR